MREILLTQGQVALVDDEDYERLLARKWHANKLGHTFYGVRNSPRPNQYKIYIHHEILGGKPEVGFEVDHIDGNALNNQKSNLRIVTKSQNSMNKHHAWGMSRYKGVWSSDRNRWQAYIKFNGVRRRLGSFDSEEKAAKAYDVAALKYFGEFACLNFE